MPKIGDNQWTKMEKKERKEAKAQAVQDGRIRWVRTLIGQGKLEQAQHYSGTYLLPFEQLLEEEQAKAEAIVKAAVQAEIEEHEEAVTGDHNIPAHAVAGNPVTIEPAGVVEQVNGWPVRAEVEVYRYPRNKRLSIVRFDDGREASCWNDSTRAWTLKSRIHVVLESAVGDPMYRAEEGQR